ncbi:MAG: glycosyltransferase family 4 protein [Actinomycetota bacterium]
MPEPIRILHVITRMVKGGAQENTLANVLGLHGEGWESSLATGPAEGPEGSLEPECLATGVRMLRVPELVRELSPVSDLRALQRLVSVFKKERPHIVHTHTSKAGIIGRIAARRAGVPIVVHTPHGHVFHSYESRLKSLLFVNVERRCAGMADRLIALTETERQEHLDLGVGAARNWRVVHSGVDFAPFEAARGEGPKVRLELGIAPRAQVIGTVGRLVPIKGQTYLLDAFSRVAAGRQDMHLVLVGDGALRAPLLSQARELGLTVVEHDQAATSSPSTPRVADRGVVHFTGLRRDVPRLMSALDLFVLPSLNEGMGRVLVEAMSMELPCIASRVSGIPDVVVDGETGWLVPSRDPAALADALGAAIREPELARARGVRGRLRVAPAFSVERMVEKLEALYRELLAEKAIVPGPFRPNIEEAEAQTSSLIGQTSDDYRR